MGTKWFKKDEEPNSFEDKTLKATDLIFEEGEKKSIAHYFTGYSSDGHFQITSIYKEKNMSINSYYLISPYILNSFFDSNVKFEVFASERGKGLVTLRIYK